LLQHRLSQKKGQPLTDYFIKATGREDKIAMETNMQRGARIIIDDWMKVRPDESVLIITEEAHAAEMELVKQYAEKTGAKVCIQLIPRKDFHLSEFFDTIGALIFSHQVIIGATHYSIGTSKIVHQAVNTGSRFLSLPMATNNGQSLLEFDFLAMDPGKSRFFAKELLKFINESDTLRVTTEAGTNLSFRKMGRHGNYFNGRAKDGKGFASSSFEVYVPIEEDRTEGIGILDGSLGYLGKVKTPFSIHFSQGRIVHIEPCEDGNRLATYLESFGDPRLYYAAEFGIGTNFNSKCEGNCYIEDESAYGTFHIGFGRNIALGGAFEADGHFDIIFLRPTIYADNRMIMENGIIIPAVPELW